MSLPSLTANSFSRYIAELVLLDTWNVTTIAKSEKRLAETAIYNRDSLVQSTARNNGSTNK